MTQIFDDAGVDAIKGSQILELLDLSPEELGIPQRFGKFREVVNFLQGFENYRYVINKITRGKQVDKLDHTWSYTMLAKERESKKKEASSLKEQMEHVKTYGGKDVPEHNYKTMAGLYADKMQELEQLDSEMELYEK